MLFRSLVRTRKNVPLREQRIALVLCVAVTAALLAWGVVWNRPQPQPSDLAPIWASARARLHQQDPYDAVGPGRTFDTAFPQIYPMTAIVTVMPLALMPLRWADPIFVGLGFGLFTWAVTTRRIMTPALVALVSLGALMILQTSQWSLLLTGAASTKAGAEGKTEIIKMLQAALKKDDGPGHANVTGVNPNP